MPKMANAPVFEPKMMSLEKYGEESARKEKKLLAAMKATTNDPSSYAIINELFAKTTAPKSDTKKMPWYQLNRSQAKER